MIYMGPYAKITLKVKSTCVLAMVERASGQGKKVFSSLSRARRAA